MVGWVRKTLAAGAFSVGLGALVAGCASGSGGPVYKDFGPLNNQNRIVLMQDMHGSVERDDRVVDGEGYCTDENDPAIHPDRPVLQYQDSHVQEFYSRVSEMRADDNATQGVSYPTTARVKIVDPDKMHEECGDYAAACNGNNLIIMPNNLGVIDFLAILMYHEMGHTNYPGAMEYPSVANEVYMTIKAYQFMKEVGSFMLNNMFRAVDDTPIEDMAPFWMMYVKGALYSIHNLIENGCDIELAMQDVTHSRLLVIETSLKKKLDELPGPTPADKYFQLWNELLANPLFFNELSGPTGHLDWNESAELIHYLKILNHRNHQWKVSNPGEVASQLEHLEGTFLAISGFTNPYFRGSVTNSHTQRLRGQLNALIVNEGLQSSDVFWKANKILELNSAYPCIGTNPYECPKSVRNIRAEHVDSYYTLALSSSIINDDQMWESATMWAKDYVERFYPDVKFDEGKFEALRDAEVLETNNYLPPIAFMAAFHAFDKGDYDTAKKFFTAAVTINCLEGDDVHGDPQICENYKMNSQILLDAYF